MPTYNEILNIEAALRQVRAAVPTAAVLVIDDSSPDGTGDRAREVANALGSITVLSRPRKAGLGSAYRDGFVWAIDNSFATVVEMDADGSHRPEHLREMFSAIDAGADVVIGSRYVHGGTTPAWPWHRRLLSRAANKYAAVALGLPVRDVTAGYRIYRTELLNALDVRSLRADGYCIQIELTYRAHQHGAQIREVPIRFFDRELGQSKISASDVFEALALVTRWSAHDRRRV